jgi:hypothetical protein
MSAHAHNVPTSVSTKTLAKIWAKGWARFSAALLPTFVMTSLLTAMTGLSGTEWFGGLSANGATKKTAGAAKTPSPKKSSQKSRALNAPKSVNAKAPAAQASNGAPAPVQTWSVANTLSGWDRYTDKDWPVSGDAITAVAREKSLVVRRRPGNGEPGLRFETGTSISGRVTLLVTRRYIDWIEVVLPVRPNGTIGWVEANQVDVLSVPFRVVVDKAANQMVIEKEGKIISRMRVATGTGNTPTPSGLFFVREVIKTDPGGPYGPYVLGLSGYSEVLNSFQGGEGAIGIHGTDQPDLIGSNASFGCVRLTNAAMSSLVRLLPLGTPIEITDSAASLPTQRRSFGTPDLVFVEPLPTPATTDDSVSIFDVPDYNPAAIDFVESQRK